MPVEQGLPWHPVAMGLAGQAMPFVVAASHAHALPSPPFWFPVPAVLVAFPALLCPSSLSAVLALVPPGVAAAFRVSVLLLPLSVGAPGCPCRAHPPVPPACPPVQGFHISVRRGLSHARLAGHGPVATPVAGTSRRAGCSPCPCGVRGHLVEGRGGVCWWLARRAPHLVVAAVLAPHVSLVYCCVSCWGSSHCRVWGGSVPSCFACVPPNFGLFLFLLARSPLLVCAPERGLQGPSCVRLAKTQIAKDGNVTSAMPVLFAIAPIWVWSSTILRSHWMHLEIHDFEISTMTLKEMGIITCGKMITSVEWREGKKRTK